MFAYLHVDSNTWRAIENLMLICPDAAHFIVKTARPCTDTRSSETLQKIEIHNFWLRSVIPLQSPWWLSKATNVCATPVPSANGKSRKNHNIPLRLLGPLDTNAVLNLWLRDLESSGFNVGHIRRLYPPAVPGWSPLGCSKDAHRELNYSVFYIFNRHTWDVFELDSRRLGKNTRPQQLKSHEKSEKERKVADNWFE